MNNLINQINVIAAGLELTIVVVGIVFVLVGLKVVVDLFTNK